MTWLEWIKSCYEVCPFAAKSRYVVMEPEHDTAFIALPEDISVVRLRTLMRILAPGLRVVGLTAIALHPEHPFQFRGKFTRRSPQPAIQLTRSDVGDAAREALQKTDYYDDYPEDDMQWGLEHLP